jgi:hypothetical protein
VHQDFHAYNLSGISVARSLKHNTSDNMAYPFMYPSSRTLRMAHNATDDHDPHWPGWYQHPSPTPRCAGKSKLCEECIHADDCKSFDTAGQGESVCQDQITGYILNKTNDEACDALSSCMCVNAAPPKLGRDYNSGGHMKSIAAPGINLTHYWSKNSYTPAPASKEALSYVGYNVTNPMKCECYTTGGCFCTLGGEAQGCFAGGSRSANQRFGGGRWGSCADRIKYANDPKHAALTCPTCYTEGRKRCTQTTQCHGQELCVQVRTGIAVSPFSTTQARANTAGVAACGGDTSIVNQYGIPTANSDCFCLDLGL